MKRTLLQRKGISATHPILLLAKEDQIIVCSVASADGKSNFDYSLVLNAKDVNLDGTDVSFGEDFCEYLLDKFEQNPDLGVAGTDYIEGTFHSYRNSYISANHVNGQCQLFRRQCFEEIGDIYRLNTAGLTG